MAKKKQIEGIEEGEFLTEPDSTKFSAGEVNITPKKDWVLVDGSTSISLKEGVSISVPEKFRTSLETEGVI